MAHQLAGSVPERSHRIARAMAKQLRAATNDETRRHLLLVLGNAGSDETLDAILPFLKDSSADVRGAAAAALRWIKAPNVDSLLCTALATDADAGVRVEAATALGFRTMTPETFKAHRIAFQKDESSSVRVALLQNLARSQSTFPKESPCSSRPDPTQCRPSRGSGELAGDREVNFGVRGSTPLSFLSLLGCALCSNEKKRKESGVEPPHSKERWSTSAFQVHN